MAKGKSSNRGTRAPTDALTQVLRSPSFLQPSSRNLLQEIEDLRSFDFDPETRPARLFDSRPAPFSIETPSRKPGTKTRVPYQIAFDYPEVTLVCVRRHRRREVLFAKKKTGRRGQRKARWSKWSNTKC